MICMQPLYANILCKPSFYVSFGKKLCKLYVSFYEGFDRYVCKLCIVYRYILIYLYYLSICIVIESIHKHTRERGCGWMYIYKAYIAYIHSYQRLHKTIHTSIHKFFKKYSFWRANND